VLGRTTHAHTMAERGFKHRLGTMLVVNRPGLNFSAHGRNKASTNTFDSACVRLVIMMSKWMSSLIMSSGVCSTTHSSINKMRLGPLCDICVNHATLDKVGQPLETQWISNGSEESLVISCSRRMDFSSTCIEARLRSIVFPMVAHLCRVSHGSPTPAHHQQVIRVGGASYERTHAAQEITPESGEGITMSA
jgi:hypothetical protein